MKFVMSFLLAKWRSWSPPSRGAWIEIVYDTEQMARLIESPPSRGAWIEILTQPCPMLPGLSPPSRGAWIEMPITFPP